MKNLLFLALTGLGLALSSCGSGDPATATSTRPTRLPYPGLHPNATGLDDDTLHYPVAPFQLTDQAGQAVSNQTLAGHAYVIDFFFATCPGICPRMQGEMLKVFKQFPTDPRVAFVSVTIDPDHDTRPVLLDYAQRLGVQAAARWHFATNGGSRDQAMAMANLFFAGAMADKQAPGGMAHNGTLALVDDQGYVRGLYDGLNDNEVNRLKQEIPVLLAEMAGRKQ